jgi:hypothetical protein
MAPENAARHFAVNPERPLQTWRVGDTRCISFGVGRLWVHTVWPPRERPNPDGYTPSANAELRIEWRRTQRRRRP